jgi:hypothetical protein
MALADIYQKATLVQIPSGYKAADAELYSVVPNTTAGDFTVSVDADATRVNKDGLIESVAANQARLDYKPSNPQDPTLLLEPERTNIYTYSQDLSQGTTLTNTSVDNDNTTSPNGSLTGNKLTQTSGAFTRKNLGVVLSGTYAWSFFAKKGDLRYLNARSLFVLNGTTPANGNTIIDLNTNTIAYKGTNVTSASIEQYPNDWIKVEIVATDNATGSGDFVDFFFTDSDTSTQSTGVAGYGFIWGVQFESGSYGTSYIPNLSSGSTTRTADTCKLENFSDMPTDYPFTVFWEGKIDDISTNQNAFTILDATSSIKYLSFTFANTGFFQVLRRNVSYDIDSQTFSMSIGDVLKIAIAFTSNTTYKCYINGSLERNETSGLDIDFDFNDILIGQLRTVSDTGTRNQASQFMLFNEALTDSELITLTS